MRLSELIQRLQCTMKDFGDLKVTIATQDKKKRVTVSGDVFISYEQYIDTDEVQIRSFPY